MASKKLLAEGAIPIDKTCPVRVTRRAAYGSKKVIPKIKNTTGFGQMENIWMAFQGCATKQQNFQASTIMAVSSDFPMEWSLLGYKQSAQAAACLLFAGLW